MKGNSGRQDYRKARFTKKEAIPVLLLCGGAVGGLAYFFYRSVWAVVPLSLVGVWLYRTMQFEKAKKRRQELSAEFRECILGVAALLQGGYSVENAFVECKRDMEMMYGEDSLICRELVGIKRGLNINVSLEELLQDLAERSACEEIEQFAQIFSQAKRSGGNVSEIMANCAVGIGKQIELQQEIRLLLGARRMEFTIMRLMPFGILLYIDLGNPGYFDGLYHNWMGVMVMTACLGVYLGANCLGEKIFKGMEEA